MTIAALAFALGAVASGLTGYVGTAQSDAVRETVADFPVTSRLFELSAQVSDDPEQDDQARAAFDRFVGDAPYDVHRSLVTEPRTLVGSETGSGEPTRVAFAAYDALREHAELVDGDWPADVGGDSVAAAVHADAAQRLGIAVGDELAFNERDERVDLVVAGLWRPRDAEHAYWAGNPLEIDGADERYDGLVVVTENAVTAFPGGAPRVRWRLVPEVDGLGAADLPVLVHGLPEVRPYVVDEPAFANASIGVVDDMVTELAEVDDTLQVAGAVVVAPLVMLAVAMLGALWLVSRLLSVARSAETTLLHARGRSRSQALAWAVRDSLLVLALPAVLGGVAAYVLLRTWATEVAPEGTAIGAAGVVVAGVIVHSWVGVLSARTALSPAGRAVGRRRFARAGGAVLLFSVAALATWQLLRYDGVTVLNVDGARQVDPLAVVAPAAVVLAGAVAAAGLVALLGRVAAGVLRRGRGLSAIFAVRTLARRPAAYVLPVVLVGFAAGSGTLAATYTATWHDAQQEVVAQRSPADVVVALPGSGLVTGPSEGVGLGAYREIDGVAEAVAVVTRTADVGSEQVELVATGGAADDAERPGIEVPSGGSAADLQIASRLQITQPDVDVLPDEGRAESAPDALETVVRLWLMDADGVVSVVATDPLDLPVDTGAATAGQSTTVPLGLPEGGAEPWRIIAVGFWFALPTLFQWQADLDIAIERITAGGATAEIPADAWTGTVLGAPQGGRFDSVDAGPAGARMTGRLSLAPGQLSSHVARTGPPVGLTATEAALEATGLEVGDEFTLGVVGVDLNAEVAGRVDALPGAPAEAMAANLDELTAALAVSGRAASPDELRLTAQDGADEAALAAAVATVADPDSTVLSRSAFEEELTESRLTSLLTVPFWLVSTVSGVLALVAAWAGAAVALRSRRAEVGLLHALGWPAAKQAGQRRREQLVVSLLAVVLGAGAGYGASLLIVPALAGSATPELSSTVAPAVALNLPMLGWYLGGLVVALLVVVVAHGRQVRKLVKTPVQVEVAA